MQTGVRSESSLLGVPMAERSIFGASWQFFCSLTLEITRDQAVHYNLPALAEMSADRLHRCPPCAALLVSRMSDLKF